MRFPLAVLLFLTIAAFGFSSKLCAQNFSKIDAYARSIPVPKKPDVKKLAEALVVGCTNEKEKARSFFAWISENIHYDIRLKDDKDVNPEKRQSLQSPEKVIKRKKAVCEGYTNLFNALCSSVGIRALEVDGITKNQRGNVSRKGHSWSLIRADGQWGLVDPTWGAGVVGTDDGKYHEQLNDQLFFASAEILIENHYPNDPLFQCLPNPLTLEDFKLPTTKLKEVRAKQSGSAATPGFEYIQDSLSAISSIDSGLYLFAAGQRSLRVNPKSNFGSWALGKYYFQRTVIAEDRYFQAIKDLKPLNYYPAADWFDAQIPILKDWESLASTCLEVVKKASGQDNYSKQVHSVRQNAQRSLSSCRSILKENPRLKANVKKGVRVKMAIE